MALPHSFGALAANPKLLELTQENMDALGIEYEVSTSTDGMGSGDGRA